MAVNSRNMTLLVSLGLRALSTQLGRQCHQHVLPVTTKQQVVTRFCSSRASAAAKVKKPDCTPMATHFDYEKNWLVVNWLDGNRSDYPFVWLRDNCQCSKCFQPNSQARILLMQDLDVNVKPQHAEILEDGDISIVWPDGHESVFQPEWLKQRCFDKEYRQKRSKEYQSPKKLWEAHEMSLNLYRDDYKNLMTSLKSLYRWLQSLQKYGLALIKNVEDRTSFINFTDHLGFARITHYGKMFSVRSKGTPSSLAYTDEKLNFHIDLPYYEYLPGVQILHCITQCDGHGGETEFADGFRIIQHMKEHHPNEYKMLTETPVGFYNIGKDFISFDKILRTPVIRLNNEGEVWQLRYNNGLRDSYMDVDIEHVKPMYEALKLFDNYLYDPQFNFAIKLQDGDMIAFDNWRLLHGRNSFTSSKDNVRELEGGYIDWDEVISRMRVLKSQLKE